MRVPDAGAGGEEGLNWGRGGGRVGAWIRGRRIRVRSPRM